jgi:hypothetical protein
MKFSRRISTGILPPITITTNQIINSIIDTSCLELLVTGD